MPTYEETYAKHADRYDELVRHEDRSRAVAGYLDRILAPPPELVVELGCGTGRVTRELAVRAARVRAYDGSPHMIEFARERCASENASFDVADNASLPEAAGGADAVVAGWTLGHVTGFFPDTWRDHARRALDEMVRVGREGAALVVFETLGTCVDRAGPPNERLAELYAMLESEYAFAWEVLDTSYAFSSREEAARVLGFFFGPAMQDRVLARGSPVVPEWTGAFFARRGAVAAPGARVIPAFRERC